MDANSAAEQILSACQQGRGEVFIHNSLNLTLAFQRLFPELTGELLALANRVLPAMGGIGREAARGYESESPYSTSFLTKATREAALLNNQH
ncbi:MAG: hypothetical protein R3C05_30030 [Pirellulaceae bacterium]